MKLKNDQSSPSRFTTLYSGRGKALIGVLCLAVGLAACSSVKEHVNEGHVRAGTFSFLNTGREMPGYAEARKEVHEAVQQALIKNLGAKGVKYVPTGGDVTVAYLIVVGNNAVTTSLNSYFGYTPDSEAFVEKMHSQQTSGDRSRSYVEAGTLVIDVVDPGTSKLLQRRTIQSQVLRDLPQERRLARLQSLV